MVAVLFLILLAGTRAPLLGDTAAYASDIAAYLGKSPFGSGNRLWEFGHLLWRPLGWVLTSLAIPLLQLTGWTPVMQATSILITLNVVAAVAAVILWYLLILDWGGTPRLAFWLALAFAFNHGFLLYAHSGCAYVPSLACSSGALYALRRGRPVLGAVLYALSSLLWFPFILAGLAFLLVAMQPKSLGNIRESLRTLTLKSGITFAVSAGIVFLLVYSTALWARNISSFDEAKNWFSESGHGWMQSIRVIRIATGLPRSFLYLGRDGVLYRRYLFGDPFAPVRIVDLVAASLWKIAAFGVFALALFYEIFRKPQWFTLVFLAALVPVLVFAVLLFEPGSPERYLPALPFLIWGVSRALQPGGAPRVSRWILVGFLGCVVLNNGLEFFRPLVTRQDTASLQRLGQLREQLPPGSRVVVASNQDLLTEVASRSPFGEINRPNVLPFYDLLEVASVRIQTWREEFANTALNSWDKQGEIWISKRLWQPKPLPEWYWVEGESPTVKWVEVPQFFADLQTDIDTGGPDGFLHLIRNQSNAEKLSTVRNRARTNGLN